MELEGFTNDCLIKLAGTDRRLEHPNVESTPQGHTLVKFTDKAALQGYSWRFEKIGDDTGGILKTIPKHPISTSPSSQPNNLLPPNSGSIYIDNAHFYTDMLLNIPRTPFTRTQRIAALDWARKLGAANVPTECKRRLDAT
ncbi:hypothetical protein B0J17DRAFT_665903 [Rhizoctonia solani]|nr:hypothetical protein B0J17DRAFT_665903 [Rhizoctonia solani]